MEHFMGLEFVEVEKPNISELRHLKMLTVEQIAHLHLKFVGITVSVFESSNSSKNCTYYQKIITIDGQELYVAKIVRREWYEGVLLYSIIKNRFGCKDNEYMDITEYCGKCFENVKTYNWSAEYKKAIQKYFEIPRVKGKHRLLYRARTLVVS